MTKNCIQCGEPFQAKRKDASFCGVKCRVRSIRATKTSGKRGRPKKSPLIAPKKRVNNALKLHEQTVSEKTDDGLLTKVLSGLPEGPASTSSPSVPDQGPDDLPQSPL